MELIRDRTNLQVLFCLILYCICSSDILTLTQVNHHPPRARSPAKFSGDSVFRYSSNLRLNTRIFQQPIRTEETSGCEKERPLETKTVQLSMSALFGMKWSGSLRTYTYIFILDHLLLFSQLLILEKLLAVLKGYFSCISTGQSFRLRRPTLHFFSI